MARPATDSTATNDVTGMPRQPMTISSARNSSSALIVERSIPNRVASTWERASTRSTPFNSSFTTSRHTRASSAADSRLPRLKPPSSKPSTFSRVSINSIA